MKKTDVAKDMEPESKPATPALAAQATSPTPEVAFDEFMKFDFRVGKILEAIPVEKSKKLMRIVVSFGTEKRQAVAGLVPYYKPEELVGKKAVFLLNLKRRVMAGYESQCMILAAEDDKGVVSALLPDKDVNEGAKIG